MNKIYCAILSCSLFFSVTSVFAAPKCSDIEPLYNKLKADKIDLSAFSSMQDINNKFSLVKQFTSGKGGASVYLVNDKNTNRLKVLKIFPVESFTKEFENNNELREIYFSCELSNLNKKYFPDFYDFGYTNTDKPFAKEQPSGKRYFYFVMEYIKGEDLFTHSQKDSALIKDVRKVKTILAQVLLALAAAHEHFGFFHRDLHPGNIMITEQGNPKIIDFGLATAKPFYKADGIKEADALKQSLASGRDHSLVLLEFIGNLVGKLGIAPATYNASEISKQYKGGDDLQFINMLIYAFRKKFGEDNFIDYCTDYRSCIAKLGSFNPGKF